MEPFFISGPPSALRYRSSFPLRGVGAGEAPPTAEALASATRLWQDAVFLDGDATVALTPVSAALAIIATFLALRVISFVPGGLFLFAHGLSGVFGGAPISLLLPPPPPTMVEHAIDGGRDEDFETTEATSSPLLKLLLPLPRRWKLRTREEAGDATAETAAGEQPEARHRGDGAEAVFRLNRPVVSGGAGISLLSLLLVRIPVCWVPGAAPPAEAAGTEGAAAAEGEVELSSSLQVPLDGPFGVFKIPSPACPHFHTFRDPAFDSLPPRATLGPASASAHPAPLPLLVLRGMGLAKTAPSPDPTSGERKRLSYDVFRLTFRDGVLAPIGSIVPAKKDLELPVLLSAPVEGCRWWSGVHRLLGGRDADAEADHPATAATAVAAAPEGVGVPQNIEPE